MQLMDKLIKEVAIEYGITQKAAREVIHAQLLLIKKVIRGKEARTVYFRKVGIFMPRVIRKKLLDEKIQRDLNKVKPNNQEEDPLTF